MLNVSRVPVECSSFLEQFVTEIEMKLNGALEAIYVYGSIADGGFDQRRSDIDLIIFLNEEVDSETLSQSLTPLLKKEWGKKVDGMFLQSNFAGRENQEMNPYPYIINGKVQTGYWNVNAITWWSIAYQGILLYGQPVDIKISWEQVEKTLVYNIEHYWTKRAAKPYTFLKDEEFADAVATLCRISYTWKEQKVISKKEAVLWASGSDDMKSYRQLKEAERLIEQKSSTYFSRIYRALACKRFVLSMIDYIQTDVRRDQYITSRTRSNVNL